jgi:hypothetical protein
LRMGERLKCRTLSQDGIYFKNIRPNAVKVSVK